MNTKPYTGKDNGQLRMKLRPGMHLWQLDPATGEVHRVDIVREPGQRPRAILVPNTPAVQALNLDNARRKLGLNPKP